MRTSLSTRSGRRIGVYRPEPRYSASIGRNGVNLGDRTVLLGSGNYMSGNGLGFVALGYQNWSSSTVGSIGNAAIGYGCIIQGLSVGSVALGYVCGTSAAATGTITMGYSTSSGHNYCIVGGVSCTSGNSYQWIIGNSASASQQNAMSCGVFTYATRYAENAWSSGRHTVSGDIQSSVLTLGGTTTNATPTEMFIGSVASNRIVLTAGSSLIVDVRAVARTTGAIGKTAVFRRSLQIDRPTNAASTTLSGAVQTLLTDTGSNAGTPPAGWALTLSADTTNGSLKVEATGDTDTILWSIEITFQQAVRA